MPVDYADSVNSVLIAHPSIPKKKCLNTFSSRTNARVFVIQIVTDLAIILIKNSLKKGIAELY
jgi:hypothetical protein